MIRIVSGGQTGADQAGWRADRRLGLLTDGWMPHGFETDAGPRPEFAREFEAIEVEAGYRQRTHANVRDSDATVWFGNPTSPGVKTTLRACQALVRPVFIIQADQTRPSDLTGWIVAHYVETLNVAGNRQSTKP